jgi:quercetin dioxygenase-like cupin family protein
VTDGTRERNDAAPPPGVEVIAWDGDAAPEESDLRERLAREGFDAFVWSDGSGADYAPHRHECDESLWVVRGEITFGVADAHHRLGPGDRLMLPAGTLHEALAGPEGVTYLIGRRRVTWERP